MNKAKLNKAIRNTKAFTDYKEAKANIQTPKLTQDQIDQLKEKIVKDLKSK